MIAKQSKATTQAISTATTTRLGLSSLDARSLALEQLPLDLDRQALGSVDERADRWAIMTLGGYNAPPGPGDRKRKSRDAAFDNKSRTCRCENNLEHRQDMWADNAKRA